MEMTGILIVCKVKINKNKIMILIFEIIFNYY